jgi:hypothetical protein
MKKYLKIPDCVGAMPQYFVNEEEGELVVQHGHHLLWRIFLRNRKEPELRLLATFGRN